MPPSANPGSTPRIQVAAFGVPRWDGDRLLLRCIAENMHGVDLDIAPSAFVAQFGAEALPACQPRSAQASVPASHRHRVRRPRRRLTPLDPTSPIDRVVAEALGRKFTHGKAGRMEIERFCAERGLSPTQTQTALTRFRDRRQTALKALDRGVNVFAFPSASVPTGNHGETDAHLPAHTAAGESGDFPAAIRASSASSR